MRQGTRIIIGITGALLAAIGLGCLNYTKAGTIDHHLEWAASNGMPAPGEPILFAGVAALAIGAAIVGFAIGRKR